MKTTATFAQDFAEMMKNWNIIMQASQSQFPNDSKEQHYQRTKEAYEMSLGMTPRP